MTGHKLLDSSLFGLLSFLFYLIRHKKDNDNPSMIDKMKSFRSWLPVIACFLYAFAQFISWLGDK